MHTYYFAHSIIYTLDFSRERVRGYQISAKSLCGTMASRSCAEHKLTLLALTTTMAGKSFTLPLPSTPRCQSAILPLIINPDLLDEVVYLFDQHVIRLWSSFSSTLTKARAKIYSIPSSNRHISTSKVFERMCKSSTSLFQEQVTSNLESLVGKLEECTEKYPSLKFSTSAGSGSRFHEVRRFDHTWFPSQGII
jgi:hypothetical protein